MRKLALVAVIALTAASLYAQEVPNPFTAQGARPREGFFHVVTSGLTAFLANAMAPVQQSLNESLAAITRSLQGSRSFGGLLFVMLISLAYGIFHAAGPGHGKTIVSSYFLANNARLRHSVAVGYLIAGVHSLAALSIVLVLYYLIRGIFSANIEVANHWIQLLTFAVIAVLGAVMLIGRILGRHFHLHLHAHGTGDEQGHGHDPAELGRPPGITMRSLVGIAVPAGVIPCPGAVAVTLFALSLNMLAVSVLSVVSISVGMGITISVTGAIVILVKQGALKAAAGGRGGRGASGPGLRRVVEIGGAALLFLFGLVFFLAQL
jgi:nickel/cobalt transporter (NicO) family protein